MTSSFLLNIVYAGEGEQLRGVGVLDLERLNAYMESAKEVTLLDTPGVKVQAEVDMMALASRLEGMIQKSDYLNLISEISANMDTYNCNSV